MLSGTRVLVTRWLGVLLVAAGVVTASGVRVKTQNGIVEGFTDTVNGVSVNKFYGIPFARPPLGDLRFRAPQPAEKWTGVRDATSQPNACMQHHDKSFDGFSGVEMWNANTNISEDCLYLNLWVPQVSGESGLTTLLWIYGGSYVYGSITLDVYDGKFLAAKKSVIVASVQYRMGVQGFLYTGTEEAPGNMGLLDQQMGMKWLYDNIERFQGNKNKITLMGESAGSASVSHHLLAPSSWPYYNNAIMQSATSFAFWAVESPEDAVSNVRRVANVLDCDNTTLDKVVQCLRKIDAHELENAQWTGNEKLVGTFSPTVDGVFLQNYPSTLVRNGDIKDADILLGTTKDEGEYFLLYFYPDLFTGDKKFIPKSNLSRSTYVETLRNIYPSASPLGLEALLQTYEYSVTPAQRGTYLDIADDVFGDRYFKCPVRKLALEHAQLASKRNTFVYSFDYKHSASPWPAWTGVMHAYEIELIFGQPFNMDKNYNEDDRRVSEVAMEYFTQFAKTGNPDKKAGSWPEFTVASEGYLVFTENGSTKVRQGYRTKECSFWENLAPKLNKQYESDLALTNQASTSYISSSVLTVGVSWTVFINTAIRLWNMSLL